MDDTVILVIDVEATCDSATTPGGGLKGEIIEIGACQVDIKSSRILEAAGIIVKPRFSPITKFCTELTSITQEEVDSGMDFSDACRILEVEWASKEKTWASWGDYDRKQFENQCGLFEVNYPFGERHLNLKTIFAALYGLKKPVGMERGLRYLGMDLEGRHHRGVDDARNIARILLKLLEEHPDAISIFR